MERAWGHDHDHLTVYRILKISKECHTPGFYVALAHTNNITCFPECFSLIVTCCGDPREDPALSVWHRRRIGGVVFPQDLHAAAPRGGRDSIRVISGPVPHQDSKVILSVYLEKHCMTVNYNRVTLNLSDLSSDKIYDTKHMEGILYVFHSWQSEEGFDISYCKKKNHAKKHQWNVSRINEKCAFGLLTSPFLISWLMLRR